MAAAQHRATIASASSFRRMKPLRERSRRHGEVADCGCGLYDTSTKPSPSFVFLLASNHPSSRPKSHRTFQSIRRTPLITRIGRETVHAVPTPEYQVDFLYRQIEVHPDDESTLGRRNRKPFPKPRPRRSPEKEPIDLPRASPKNSPMLEGQRAEPLIGTGSLLPNRGNAGAS